MKVALAVGADGSSMAHVIGLPGCFAIASTAEETLARTPEAAARYIAFLRERGEHIIITEQIEVAETHRVRTSFPGTPSDQVAFFQADQSVMSEAEIERALRWAGYAQKDIVMAVEGLASEALTDLTDGDWTLRMILLHIGRAEVGYVYRLGFADADPLYEQGNAPETDPVEYLRTVRDWSTAHLSSLTPDQRQRVYDHDGDRWTARKVLRRLLEHQWEHLEQIRALLPRT